jgi:acyl carrier protein
LFIGGEGLARGYVRRPALTAERFIPDPFSNRPGARLYRTGDIARYRDDGELEFLGRKDNQVKIRGFRIEPGETEAALAAHPAIRDLVVCAHEDGVDNKRLVAYIVFEPDQTASITELRNFLKSRLPDYLVPSLLIPLPVLPLLPNGKIDRRALPEPASDRPVLEKSYVAPRTAVEEQLAQIWSRMLKVERVGIHDNFFELGGHSLLATQVISQMREAFMIELSPRQLFAEPTVAQLAVLITQLQASRQDAAEMHEMLSRIENLTEAEARALFEATI